MRRSIAIGAGVAAVAGVGAVLLWGGVLGLGGESGGKPGPVVSLDLMPMLVGEECGYLGTDGKMAINPQFDFADFFLHRSGLAIVQVDGKHGIIDRDGKYTANPQFEHLMPADGDRLFWAQLGDKWGLVDQTGKYVVNPQFEDVNPFDERGWAVVEMGDKQGMVDRKGEWVIQPQFDEIHASYPVEGVFAQLPVYFAEDRAAARIGDRWGFIDREGNWVINPQFVNQGMFDESGLAPAAIEVDGEARWGFVDREGKWAVNPQFAGADRFDGAPLAAVQMVGGDWGFVGEDGKYTVNPRFAAVGRFGRNSGKWLAAATEDDDSETRKFGYVDERGAFAIDPQFAFAGLFDENRRARVRFGDDWGLIGPDGKFEVNPSYDLLVGMPGSNLYFFVTDDPKADEESWSAKFGVIDATGKERSVWIGEACGDIF